MLIGCKLQDPLFLALVEEAKVLPVETNEGAPVFGEYFGIHVHKRDSAAERDSVLRVGQGGGADNGDDRTHSSLDSKGWSCVATCAIRGRAADFRWTAP